MLAVGETQTHFAYCGSEPAEEDDEDGESPGSGFIPVQETGPSMLFQDIMFVTDNDDRIPDEDQI